jgi:hypothetical protein
LRSKCLKWAHENEIRLTCHDNSLSEQRTKKSSQRAANTPCSMIWATSFSRQRVVMASTSFAKVNASLFFLASISPWLMIRPYVLSYYSGAALDKVLLNLGKRSRKIALDVEFGCELFFDEDRNDDFRLHQRGSRQVTRICSNVVYYHDLSTLGCRATEPPVERNAGVGRKTAHERSNRQDPGVCRIDEIKAHLVVLRHLFVQTLGDALHE